MRVPGAGKSALWNLGLKIRPCFFRRSSFKKGSSSPLDRLRDGAVGSEWDRRGREASLTRQGGRGGDCGGGGGGRMRGKTGSDGGWGEAPSRLGGRTSNAGRVAQTELVTRNAALKAGTTSPVPLVAKPPRTPVQSNTSEQSRVCIVGAILHQPALFGDMTIN